MSSPRQDLAHVIALKTINTPPSRLAKEIAAYLLEHNQANQLESLLRDVMAYRESVGNVEATVVSAHDIDDSILKEVKALVKAHKPHAKNVHINTAHDPEVIGGLKVRLAHEQLDMTVRAKLDTFKRLTTEGAN